MTKYAVVIALLAISLLISSCIPRTRKNPYPSPPVTPTYPTSTDYTMISFKEKSSLSYNSLIANLEKYDVIFLGELHTDEKIHRLQLKIIKSLQQKNKLKIAMEMFEQDTQNYLDKYLDNKMKESTFLAMSRPWYNYKVLYRPIVEHAKQHEIPIIAMNVPKPILKKVLIDGRAAINKLSEQDRQWIAENIEWDNPVYKNYFYNSFPYDSHNKEKENTKIRKNLVKHFFIASLLKDTTMANAIVENLDTDYKIVSINGKFHSDYGIAIPREILKIDTNIKIGIVSFIKDSGAKRKGSYFLKPKIADYIIFVQ